MIPAADVRQELNTLGVEANRVEMVGTELTRNMVYKVITPHRRYALKIFRDDPFGTDRLDIMHIRTVTTIHREVAELLPYVDPPVGELIEMRYGPAQLYPWVDGFHPLRYQEIYTKSTDFCRKLGEELGTMHHRLKGVRGEQLRGGQLYQEPLPDLVRRLSSEEWEGRNRNMSERTLESIRKLAGKISEELDRYSHEHTVIHADLHFSNMQLSDGGRIQKLIDWDSMRYDVPLAETFSLMRRLSESRTHMRSLWEGYIGVVGQEYELEYARLILWANYLRLVYKLNVGGIIAEEGPMKETPPWMEEVIEILEQNL